MKMTKQKIEQINQLVVGYDIRECWETFNQSWSDIRKKTFLYKQNIEKPLSVDTRVWASIFTSEHRQEPFRRSSLQNILLFLQDAKDSMKMYLQQHETHSCCLIAITILLDDDNSSENTDWSLILSEVNPKQLGRDWELIGYDVCDQCTLSVLSNCGFNSNIEGELNLRAKFGRYLNKFHLFEFIEHAIEFKDYSNIRLKNDHAPCLVFGIWKHKKLCSKI